MEPEGRIVRKTTVRDAEKMLTVPTVVVEETDGLCEMAKKVAENPACRTLAVTDTTGKLKGIIPVNELIDEVFLWIVPEDFLVDIVNYESAMDFAGKLNVKNAKDLMHPPVWVKMEDTVRDAFDHLHKNRLSGLPIIDDQGVVIGYLDMLELLVVWIRTKGRINQEIKE